MEMGANHDGFYHQATKDDKGLRCYLCHLGFIDQECPFFAHSIEFIGREARRYVYPRDGCSLRVPVSIVSDCDVRFNSRFWQKFQKELGMRL